MARDSRAYNSSLVRWGMNTYILLLIIFLLSPIALIIPMSFNSTGSLTFPPDGFSLQWYENLFASPSYMRALRNSLIVTLFATLGSLAIGCLVCYGIARYRFRGRGVLVALLMSPLIFPQIVLGLAMIMFLSTLGLLRTLTGLALASIVVTLPYVVRTISPALENADRSLDDAAQVLGANRFQVIRYVVLPNIRAGLVAAATLCAIVAFDEFTVALFITGGNMVTLPVQIYHDSYYGVSPTVAAVGTLLIVLSAAVVFVLERTIGIGRVLGLPDIPDQ